MGASQGRPADGKARKGKKGGDKHAPAPPAPGKQATQPPANEHHTTHHHHHHHHHAVAASATPAKPALTRATSNPLTPAMTVAAPPSVAAAVPPSPVPPEFDEHSHPFHAPLDHVRLEERPLQELSASTHFDVTTLRRLQVIFDDIAAADVADGIIDGNELTDAMGLSSSCLLASTIYRVFGMIRSIDSATRQQTFKKIDFAQWVRTISALSVKATLEEKIRFSFQLYDLNGDGSIDLEELRAMLEAAVKDENVLHLSDEEIHEWCGHTLSQVDSDGDGKVDFDEYRSMVQNSVKFLESFTLDIQELASTFRFTAKRQSERMTLDEMDQRLHWFRARQKQHSSRSNSQHSSQGSHSQDGSQNETTPPLARAHSTNLPPSRNSSGKKSRGGSGKQHQHQQSPRGLGVAHQLSKGGSATKGTGLGSGIHKPILIDATPSLAASSPALALAPAASLAQTQSAGASHSASRGLVAAFHSSSCDSSPRVHSDSGNSSASDKQSGVQVTLAPVVETSFASPSASAEPVFHSDKDSPSPLPPARHAASASAAATATNTTRDS